MTNPFSPAGRYSRTTYAVSLAVLLLIVLGIRNLVVGNDPATMGAVLLFTFAMTWPFFCSIAKRLHDADRSSSIAFLGLGFAIGYDGFATMARYMAGSAIEMANAAAGFCGVSALVIAVIAMCFEGDVGPNRFGYDPREGNLPEKAPEIVDMDADDVARHPTALPDPV